MNRIPRRIKNVNGQGQPLRISSGKVVGRLIGTAARFKVKRSKHFFGKLHGYSADARILAELERMGVEMLEFQDSELDQTFRISLNAFLANATRCPDYGHGLKLVAHERFYHDDSMDDLLPGMIATTNGVGLSVQEGA